MACKLNSAQVMDPERDGFYVELTFVKTLGRGGKTMEEANQKETLCYTNENKDNLCCARAVVTIKEFVDKGSPKRTINTSRSTPN